MTGRGVDQILPHSCSPELYESYLSSAADYVALAEQVSGPIPRSAEYTYVWGDAIEILAAAAPDARIINLETAITCDGQPYPKGINYRMHPDNTLLLQAAAIDSCVLANNHVLDWGEHGLIDTLNSLSSAGIACAGAGRSRAEAERPALIPINVSSRIVLFAVGAQDSGVPSGWSATETTPGVAVLPDFSDQTAEGIARLVHAAKQPGDVIVVSIHWGANWGYEIPTAHRHFAHALIDRHAADIVYGHSSHHPKAIEIYQGRLILYGCGDLLNDYEGIRGYEEFGVNLALAYLATVEGISGTLQRLEMVPFRIQKFRLNYASTDDVEWLGRTLDRECRRLGHRVLKIEDRLLLSIQNSPRF